LGNGEKHRKFSLQKKGRDKAARVWELPPIKPLVYLAHTNRGWMLPFDPGNEQRAAGGRFDGSTR